MDTEQKQPDAEYVTRDLMAEAQNFRDLLVTFWGILDDSQKESIRDEVRKVTDEMTVSLVDGKDEGPLEETEVSFPDLGKWPPELLREYLVEFPEITDGFTEEELAVVAKFMGDIDLYCSEAIKDRDSDGDRDMY